MARPKPRVVLKAMGKSPHFQGPAIKAILVSQSNPAKHVTKGDTLVLYLFIKPDFSGHFCFFPAKTGGIFAAMNLQG